MREPQDGAQTAMPVDPNIYATFVVAAALMCLVPGPDMLFILVMSGRHGPRGGAAAAVGMAAGMLVHTTAAVVGLSALLRASATAFEALRALGALYLIWLAVESWRSTRLVQDADAPVIHVSSWQIGRQGLLTNVSNPKIIIFFLAFLPQFVAPERAGASLQLLVFGLTFTAVGLAFDLLVGVAAGRLIRRLVASVRRAKVFGRISALVFVGLAGRLVIDR